MDCAKSKKPKIFPPIHIVEYCGCSLERDSSNPGRIGTIGNTLVSKFTLPLRLNFLLAAEHQQCSTILRNINVTKNFVEKCQNGP